MTLQGPYFPSPHPGRASTSKEQRMNNRYALGVIAALALAGCGSQVAPTGMTGAASASFGKSWMRSEAKGEDLMYVSPGAPICGATGTCVYSYPEGKLVGEVSASTEQGLCSDSQGDVFIPSGGSSGAY